MSEQYKHYSMKIQWSVPDNAYIVTVPELPGCETRGATYQEAARHAQEAIDIWIDEREKSKQPIPAPRLYQG